MGVTLTHLPGVKIVSVLGTSLGAAIVVRERRVTDQSDIEFRSDMTVELVKANASDADVLFAARVSTKGEQSLEDVGSDATTSRGLISYLMRDRHGCYDEQTEVLTNQGWKPWPDVTGHEQFVTRSSDGLIEYQRASHHIAKRYDGPMIRIDMAQSRPARDARPSHVGGRVDNAATMGADSGRRQLQRRLPSTRHGGRYWITDDAARLSDGMVWATGVLHWPSEIRQAAPAIPPA